MATWGSTKSPTAKGQQGLSGERPIVEKLPEMIRHLAAPQWERDTQQRIHESTNPPCEASKKTKETRLRTLSRSPPFLVIHTPQDPQIYWSSARWRQSTRSVKTGNRAATWSWWDSPNFNQFVTGVLQGFTGFTGGKCRMRRWDLIWCDDMWCLKEFERFGFLSTVLFQYEDQGFRGLWIANWPPLPCETTECSHPAITGARIRWHSARACCSGLNHNVLLSEENTRKLKLLCFEWSPPWHSVHPIWHSVWQIFCLLAFYLAYLRAFYLSYLLAFHLACLLTFHLAYLLTFYLAYLLTFYLAFYLADLLTFYLAYLLTFCLSYLLTFNLAYLSGVPSGMSSDILSGISSDILSGILSGIPSGISSNILSGIPSGRSSDILSDIPSRRLKSGEAHSAPNLAGWSPARPTALRPSPVEVRQGPQRSDSCQLKSGEAHGAPTLAGWRPARPTAIKSWQKRSGDDHCDQELADEVRRWPLRNTTGRWGPAKITAIKSWQMRSGEENEEQEEEEENPRIWHKI